MFKQSTKIQKNCFEMHSSCKKLWKSITSSLSATYCKLLSMWTILQMMVHSSITS